LDEEHTKESKNKNKSVSLDPTKRKQPTNSRGTLGDSREAKYKQTNSPSKKGQATSTA